MAKLVVKKFFPCSLFYFFFVCLSTAKSLAQLDSACLVFTCNTVHAVCYIIKFINMHVMFGLGGKKEKLRGTETEKKLTQSERNQEISRWQRLG